MVKHVVVWKLKERIDDKLAATDLLKRELEALKSKINVIHQLEVGVNFNPSHDAFDLALISEFHNRNDLEYYQNHPEHQRVIGILRQYRDVKVVVDYEKEHILRGTPPLVKHVVLLKIKDGADGMLKPENIARLRDELEHLPPKIREIVSFEVGTNFNPSGDAYDLSVIAEVKSRKDLESYLRHPDHQKVVAVMNRVRDARVFVDYEIDTR